MWLLAWMIACPKDKPCQDCDTDTDVADTDDTDIEDTSPQDRDDDGYASDVDCDDEDPDVHPDATEVCGDAVDDDCDGRAPACRKGGDFDAEADAVLTVTGTLDWAEVGYGLARGGDVTGDGIDDLLIGARLDDTNGYRAGAVHVLSGTARADVDAHSLPTLLGEARDYAGTGITFAGDLDGDGQGDLVVGADRNSERAGSAYLVYGPVSGTTKLTTRASILNGTSTDDRAGMFLAGVGDWTGDALDDVLIAAPFDDTAGKNAGRVFLIAGDATRPGERWLEDAAVSILTGELEEVAGYNTAALGDVNGDGLTDAGVIAAVGGWGDLVLLLETPPAGSVPLADIGSHLGSSPTAGRVGSHAGPLGDTNHDGYDDFWVLGWGTGPDTAVQSLYAFTSSAALDLDAATAVVRPVSTFDYDVIYAAAGDGDGDGDGEFDLLVTMVESRAQGGGAFLYYGPVEGHFTTEEADVSWMTTEPSGSIGTIASWTRDFDGDGHAEVAVGANLLDNGGVDRGSLFLFSAAATE